MKRYKRALPEILGKAARMMDCVFEPSGRRVRSC